MITDVIRDAGADINGNVANGSAADTGDGSIFVETFEVDSNTIDGGADDDEIIGGDGDDKLRGGDGDDGLFGGLGDDLVFGGDGEDEENQ